MPRPLKLILLLGVALVLGFNGWRQFSRERADADVFSGTIEARESRIGSKTGGRVGRLLVREGDSVQKGQRILEFDSDELREELAASEAAGRQAREALRELQAGTRPEQISRLEAAERQARSQLRKLQNGSRPEEIAAARAAAQQAEAVLQKLQRGPRDEEVRRAKAALDAAAADRELARVSLERSRTLYSDGAIARQVLDEAERQAAVAEAAERQARQTLEELQAGTRPEDIRAAKEALNQAREQYRLVMKGARHEDVAAAQAALEQAQALLREGRAGARPEQIAQARAAMDQADARTRALTVASLIDPADIFVKFYLPARKLSKLHAGDRVSMETDDGRQVAGVVEQIPEQGEFTPRNRQTREDRDLEVFAVKVRVDNPDGNLRAGMSLNTRVGG